MIGQASGHCGCNSQSLMNPAEIVVHAVQGNRRDVVVDLL
jgi:hypothetical protein